MERRPIDRFIHPLQVFASHKVSGGVLLMAAAALSVFLVNSPWSATFHGLLAQKLHIGISGFGDIEKPLLLWINDGLMGVFFFHVGLEIKRETKAGELSTLRKAILPALAALGGVLVPAAMYWMLNTGKPGEAGWGVPMATDIAFALGVLALLGSRVPDGLKIFLMALAIVDDIAAILVIAIFYTESVSLTSLGIGAALLACGVVFNRLHVRSEIVYLLLGMAVWVAFLKSGVHATIAALLMAFTIPTATRIDGHSLLNRVKHYANELKRVGVPDSKRMNTPA